MISGTNPQAGTRPLRRKRSRASSSSLADVTGSDVDETETETETENAKHAGAFALVQGNRKRSRGWTAALATRAAVLCKVIKRERN